MHYTGTAVHCGKFLVERKVIYWNHLLSVSTHNPMIFCAWVAWLLLRDVDFADLLKPNDSFINFDTCQLICNIPLSYPFKFIIKVQSIEDRR